MNVLRAITYLLTSLASLLFIFVVIYGAVQINTFTSRLQNAFPGASTTSPSFTTEPGPPPDATGDEIYCFYNPGDPMCPE